MSIHINAKLGEIAGKVLMPGDPLRAKYIAENFLESVTCYSDVRNMYGFTGTYKGNKVSIQGSGMGMPSMGIYSWELISEYNVTDIIRIGTCGVFSEDIKLGDVLLATSASTDSNFHHAFNVPCGYAPCAGWNLLKNAYEASKEFNISITAGNIVSCDVFYETENNWWRKWADMGVLGVEMEAAALYMNCAYHKVNGLALLTVTDHFVTKENATTEERLKANNQMIELALETIIK